MSTSFCGEIKKKKYFWLNKSTISWLYTLIFICSSLDIDLPYSMGDNKKKTKKKENVTTKKTVKPQTPKPQGKQVFETSTILGFSLFLYICMTVFTKSRVCVLISSLT